MNAPQRSAWIDIDQSKLRKNLKLIRKEIPAEVKYLCVVKDDAYGHGTANVAKLAMEMGAWGLGVSTLDEALEIRDAGIDTAPILLFYERHPSELEYCSERGITICTGNPDTVSKMCQIADRMGRSTPLHIKINTGMNRYGVRWDSAMPILRQASANRSLAGVMTHFAKSYSQDKTFSNLQFERFSGVLKEMDRTMMSSGIRHACNSGGFLNLGNAHLDMVRSGILYTGVTPFSCRKIAGLQSVMSVKARIVAIQQLQVGDVVGYGMNFTAHTPRRIAVLPFGYGDGYPRVCNEGRVLIHGASAPIIGGNSMDSTMVDITDIPQAHLWDTATVMGMSDVGPDKISVYEIAKLTGSVTYDVFTKFTLRMKRVLVGE